MLRTSVFLLATLLVVAVQAQAQRDRVDTPRFDVVSIKQSALTADERASSMARVGMCPREAVEISSNAVLIPVATVCGLVRLAYDANEYEVIGIPGKFSTADPANWFEIRATLDRQTTPTIEDIRPMLQRMLAERFQLRVHRQPTEMGVYALVVAKGGPKLTPCTDPDAPSVYAPGHMQSCKPPRLPMARVAQMLTRETRRLVIDRTGIMEPPSFES
jgi:uncharacterized protein (TIGR03435 family)